MSEIPTLIYSPGVRVYISTEKHGILDVSDDLTAGTMVRRVDGVSTFDCTMMNARRKYDGVFTPNDRIIVFFKRLTWLREFTGYLNSVPLKTTWPQDISLSASCSLKRLQYYYWDPNNAQTYTMIMNAMSTGSALGSPGGGGKPDGQVLEMIMQILERVAGWPRSNVHVGAIPSEWSDIMIRIATRVEDWVADAQADGLAYLRSLSPGAIFSGETGDANLSATSAGDYAGALTSDTYAGQHLNAAQKANVETIISTASSILAAKVPDSNARNLAIITALITADQESTFLNLANPSIPASLTVAHDVYADGSNPKGDLDSVGVFQQRGSGWGTLQQRMNVASATTSFINALLARSGWESMAPGNLAQAVQVSAYPDAYAPHIPVAQALLAEAQHNHASAAQQPSTPGQISTPSLGQTTGVALRDTAVQLVTKYPGIPYTQQYGGTQPAILGANPPPGLDCSSFVQAVYLRVTGSVGACPRVSHDQAAWTRRVSVAEALGTPGGLVFKTSNGSASGVYHVEMSMGDGHTTVGAHHTGSPASVEDSGAGYWDLGGLIPTITYSGADPGVNASAAATPMQQYGGRKIYPVAAQKNPTFAYHHSFSDGPSGPYPDGKDPGCDWMGATAGDPVRTLDAGTIVSADATGWGADYGNQVIQQVGGFQILYSNLGSIDAAAKPGATIAAGATVGAVGTTGRASVPVCHVEVREAPYGYENTIDPMTFIRTGVSVPIGTGTADGSAGTTETGVALLDFPKVSSLPGYDPSDRVTSLFGNNYWRPMPIDNDPSSATATSSALTGALALMNDQPMLPYLKNLFYSTMRSFCSAPNGDLIGWFPDYYGLWGTAAILRLEPIEIADFNVTWSDDTFVTHQFAQAGTATAMDLTTGDIATDNLNAIGLTLTTHGIANIDNPDLLEAMFGVQPDNAADFSAWVYQKFGARPNYYSADGLRGPKAELFLAVHMFMIQWAYQYRADIPVSFMPEAWPGMLAQIPTLDFQAYITAVTHTFQFGDEGSFQTTLNTTAPAYMPKNGKADPSSALFGLPLAGNYSPGRGIGNTEAYSNPSLTTQHISAPGDVDLDLAQPDDVVLPGDSVDPTYATGNATGSG